MEKMENYAFFSKAIRYQKTATDSAFALLSVVQSNSGDLLKRTLEHCNWLPDYGKKGCLYWSDNYLKSTKNIKSFIDQGYEEAERLFKSSEVEELKKSPLKTKEDKPTPPTGTKKANSKSPSTQRPKPSLSGKSKSSPKKAAPKKAASSSAAKLDDKKDSGIIITEELDTPPKDEQTVPTISKQPETDKKDTTP